MVWLRGWLQRTLCGANWQWLLLYGLAAAISILIFAQGTTEWTNTQEGFDRMLECGKWGIRFLLFSLAMTPLHAYLHWSGALKLRKPAGLWAFAFGVTHFLLYAVETWEAVPVYRTSGLPWHWLAWPIQLYVALGLVALCILIALAVTSNKWAMRRLGRRWKQLHRLVYCAGIAVTIHALLASSMSKKMTVLDPDVVPELRAYLGILIVLLTLRVPQVRSLLLKRVAKARPQAQPSEPVVSIVLPSRPQPLRQWPTLHMPDNARIGVGRNGATAPIITPATEGQPERVEATETIEREPAL